LNSTLASFGFRLFLGIYAANKLCEDKKPLSWCLSPLGLFHFIDLWELLNGFQASLPLLSIDSLEDVKGSEYPVFDCWFEFFVVTNERSLQYPWFRFFLIGDVWRLRTLLTVINGLF
jgi:hypothetical protein